jgi:hypothetical protein
VEVRQFLWDEIGLKALFTGSGFTMDDNGRQGPPEYLAKNTPLDEIAGAVVVDVVPR